ncbi:MAG: c-type cytochrome [Anaerolineales bacterium]|nr:c-type cytochrome [Anaerolineales bacterium]
MDDEQKQRYLEKYKQAKQQGVKFFPDIIYKDLLVSFALFIILVMLATFVGVANEPKADPSDSSYIPRPEWYFLFLFEMLKFFPGQIEWVGTIVVPTVAILALFLLPFLDRKPARYPGKRWRAIGVMGVVVLAMIALTIRAVITTPPQVEAETVATTLSESILIGQDLYSINCVECHGPDGEGGIIEGVEGLEGYDMKSISAQDEMYTRTDDTLFNVINYGQPDLGMQPFGIAYGGELSIGEIETIVDFMRYTWDDRAELPQEVTQASAMPTLGEDQVPSYDVHIEPLVKRYCISCHRPGKKNNNYLMQSYEEVMNTGDHAPNVIPGDLASNLIRMLHREEIDAGGPMPPTKALKPEIIAIFERWVLGGAPQTPEEAAAAGTVVTGTLTAPQTTAIPTP